MTKNNIATSIERAAQTEKSKTEPPKNIQETVKLTEQEQLLIGSTAITVLGLVAIILRGLFQRNLCPACKEKKKD